MSLDAASHVLHTGVDSDYVVFIILFVGESIDGGRRNNYQISWRTIVAELTVFTYQLYSLLNRERLPPLHLE